MSIYEKLEKAAKRLSEIHSQGLPEGEESNKFALALDDVFGQAVFFNTHRGDPERLALVWMPRDDAVAIAEIDLREALCRRGKILNIWALLDELIALLPLGGG